MNRCNLFLALTGGFLGLIILATQPADAALWVLNADTGCKGRLSGTFVTDAKGHVTSTNLVQVGGCAPGTYRGLPRRRVGKPIQYQFLQVTPRSFLVGSTSSGGRINLCLVFQAPLIPVGQTQTIIDLVPLPQGHYPSKVVTCGNYSIIYDIYDDRIPLTGVATLVPARTFWKSGKASPIVKGKIYLNYLDRPTQTCHAMAMGANDEMFDLAKSVLHNVVKDARISVSQKNRSEAFKKAFGSYASMTKVLQCIEAIANTTAVNVGSCKGQGMGTASYWDIERKYLGLGSALRANPFPRNLKHYPASGLGTAVHELAHAICGIELPDPYYNKPEYNKEKAVKGDKNRMHAIADAYRIYTEAIWTTKQGEKYRDR